MPIIASRASAAYGAGFGKLLSSVTGDFGSYESIASVIVPSGGLTSITFNSIPTGYESLEIRATYRSTTGAGDGTVFIQFNNDSSANYTRHRIYTYGSGTMGGDTSTGQTSGALGHSMGATPSIQAFTGLISTIPHYASTTRAKSVRSLTGTNTNDDGSGAIFYNTAGYNSLNPITSITLITNQTSFAQNSHFALYGVK